MHVILVESNGDLRNAYAAFLREEGYDVTRLVERPPRYRSADAIVLGPNIMSSQNDALLLMPLFHLQPFNENLDNILQSLAKLKVEIERRMDRSIREDRTV